jgi:hypothetical protein
VILYIDIKGYFDPDQVNNHTKKKWESFYSFTEKNSVDILLLGNSHLYTGINPKNLSLALGVNAFILASPGTNIADTYFSLREALDRTDPKLVIIETYGIDNFNPFELSKSGLSDQLKSFYARKNFFVKLSSMPYLFTSDNYFYAWSNTLRNHGFIFNNRDQLTKNRALIAKKSRIQRDLYLGRYVCFLNGIDDKLIEKYDSLGSPVKGYEYSYSNYSYKYIKRIVNLCKRENVELVFLTLPMYERHISDYSVWRDKLSEILGRYPNRWINMQTEPYYCGFDRWSFQNTYKGNQHMTYNGSLLATYKLAGFIRDSLNISLPERDKDDRWHDMFYGSEGYFDNFCPKDNDRNNICICSNRKLQNVVIDGCFLLDINNKDVNRLIAKVDKRMLEGLKFEDLKLRILLKFELDGTEQITRLDLTYDILHQPEEFVIFNSYIKPVHIKEIVDGAIIKR